MKFGIVWTLLVVGWGMQSGLLLGEEDASRVYLKGEEPGDGRFRSLKDLDGHFPLVVPKSLPAWEARAEEVRRRVMVATGLWPFPERTPLNPVIHGKVERDGFTVEKVYFESVPGLYVTGLLFRPEGGGEKRPGVLCPHGHGGRLQDHGEEGILREIVRGAERFEGSGRFPKVARCAQLARMGCVTFLYDMIGYADNRQLSYELAHRFAEQRPEFEGRESWGFYSAQAELRLQSILGVQAWNSVRALDFLEGLPDVDPERLGVTGGSGGGTQTILLGAMDARPRVAFPQGMVSTSMQGGCTCENASLLRIGTGNVELAALFAPRPQAMTAADDWTRDMLTDGFPQLQGVYELYGAEDRVACHDLTHFPHNYNYVSRALMYSWFNKHLQLGMSEPVVEADFAPLTAEEHAVWNENHPEPEGGDGFERSLTKRLAEMSDRQMEALRPQDASSLEAFRGTVGAAWATLIGRAKPDHREVSQEILRQQDVAAARLSYGEVELPASGEKLPVVVALPGAEVRMTQDFVLWIDGGGKAALLGEGGVPVPPVAKLLEAGRPVVMADVFGQGELAEGAGAEGRNRTVENPREYAGYTYGYNDSLFAQRVHDILTLIAAMERDAGAISVVGTGGAGPWVAAACAVGGDQVRRVAVDTQGFRFAGLEDYRAENFLPGAVKYGDVPVLLALCAPRPLWVGGEAEMPAWVSSVYEASGSENLLHLAPSSENDHEDVVRWLLETPVEVERVSEAYEDEDPRESDEEIFDDEP